MLQHCKSSVNEGRQFNSNMLLPQTPPTIQKCIYKSECLKSRQSTTHVLWRRCQRRIVHSAPTPEYRPPFYIYPWGHMRWKQRSAPPPNSSSKWSIGQPPEGPLQLLGIQGALAFQAVFLPLAQLHVTPHKLSRRRQQQKAAIVHSTAQGRTQMPHFPLNKQPCADVPENSAGGRTAREVSYQWSHVLFWQPRRQLFGRCCGDRVSGEMAWHKTASDQRHLHFGLIRVTQLDSRNRIILRLGEHAEVF